MVLKTYFPCVWGLATSPACQLARVYRVRLLRQASLAGLHSWGSHVVRMLRKQSRS